MIKNNPQVGVMIIDAAEMVMRRQVCELLMGDRKGITFWDNLEVNLKLYLIADRDTIQPGERDDWF